MVLNSTRAWHLVRVSHKVGQLFLFQFNMSEYLFQNGQVEASWELGEE